MPDLNDLSSSSWQKRRQAVETLLGEQAGAGSLAGDPAARAALQKALLQILRESHHDLGALNAALKALTGLGKPVIAGLGELLQDANPETRALAVIALGEQQDERALPLLLLALEDPNTNVRFNGVEALGKLGSRQAVEPLLEIIDQGQEYLSYPAIRSLAQIGDPTVVPRLAGLLSHEMLSLPAAEALGQLSDPEIIRHLAAWLESPTGDAASAATALGNLYRRCERLPYQGPCAADLIQTRAGQWIGPGGRGKILAELERFSSRPGRTADYLPDLVRLAGWLLEIEPRPAAPLEGQSAAGLNVRLRSALVQMLGRPAVSSIAAQSLQHLGQAVLPDLIARLGDPDLEVRQVAIMTLGGLGQRSAIPALLGMLDLPDPFLAATAAAALGHLGDPEAFHPLCARLDHPAAIVRQAILGAINALSHPDHNRTMLALTHDPSPLVREAAIRSLAYFGAPQAEEIILAARMDPDENVRRAAIEGLPFIDDERAAAALADQLHSGPPGLRAAAARAMGYLEAGFATPQLQQALHDADPWTRLYACRALAHLAGAPDDFLPLLADPMPPVRSEAASALSRWGEPRVAAALQTLLEDEEEEVVLAAIHSLAAGGAAQAAPLLAGLLEKRSGHIQAAALVGLGQLGGQPAMQSLQKAARSPAMQTMALQGLSAAAPEQAAPVLVHLLSETDPQNPPTQHEMLKRLLAVGQPLGRAALAALHSQPANDFARQVLTELLYRLGELFEPDLLIGMLADPLPSIRQVALLALAETHITRALPNLASMARSDPDQSVRNTAGRATQYLNLFASAAKTELP